MSFDAGDPNPANIFEGREEIARSERGATFSMSRECYYRMASCAMNLAAVGIEPAVLAHLPGDQPGCLLTLFGVRHMFEIAVRVRACDTVVNVTAQPLGGLTAVIPIYSGYDDDASWSRAMRAICAAENVGLYDSFWAAEQT